MADTRLFQCGGGVVRVMDVPVEGTYARELHDEKVASGDLVEVDADGVPVNPPPVQPDAPMLRQERRAEPVPNTEGKDRDERRAEPSDAPDAGRAFESLPMDKTPGSVTGKGIVDEHGDLVPFSPLIDTAVATAVEDARKQVMVDQANKPVDVDNLPALEVQEGVKDDALKADINLRVDPIKALDKIPDDLVPEVPEVEAEAEAEVEVEVEVEAKAEDASAVKAKKAVKAKAPAEDA